MRCSDITEISEALKALPPDTVALDLARQLSARGIAPVVVSATLGKVTLTYERPLVTVVYSDNEVTIATRFDNGHDSEFAVDPRRYSFIAAILKAST